MKTKLHAETVGIHSLIEVTLSWRLGCAKSVGIASKTAKGYQNKQRTFFLFFSNEMKFLFSAAYCEKAA